MVVDIYTSSIYTIEYNQMQLFRYWFVLLVGLLIELNCTVTGSSNAVLQENSNRNLSIQCFPIKPSLERGQE